MYQRITITHTYSYLESTCTGPIQLCLSRVHVTTVMRSVLICLTNLLFAQFCLSLIPYSPTPLPVSLSLLSSLCLFSPTRICRQCRCDGTSVFPTDRVLVLQLQWPAQTLGPQETRQYTCTDISCVSGSLDSF